MKAASVSITLILVLTFTICRAQIPGNYILLEEFSTAPCGFCPDGDVIAAQLLKDYPNVIWVTHHAGFGIDSMTAPNSIPIASVFTTFAPAACINRMDIPIPVYTKPPYIAISRQKWDSIIGAHQPDTALANLEIINDYQVSSKSLTCKVNVLFDKLPAQGNFRINLFIVEDSVVGFGKGYDQKNYYNTTAGHPMYGRGNPVVGYVHHHVVRKIPSGAWGVNGIIPSIPELQEKYSYTFTDIEIPGNWNSENIDIVAFVSCYDSDPHKRQVLNSNHKMMLDRSTNRDELPFSSPDKITLTPNPARSFIRLQCSDEYLNTSRLVILNMQGQEVYAQTIDHRETLVTFTKHFTAGLYVCKIVSPDGSSVYKKFIATGW